MVFSMVLLAFLSYSDRPVMHVVKEWDNVSPSVLVITCMFMVLHDNLVLATGLIMYCRLATIKRFKNRHFKRYPFVAAN